MKKQVFTASLGIFAAVWCFGQTNFARGEDLFMQNKPNEARIYLENAIVEDPAHVRAFMYLGIVYEQIHRIDEAIVVYRQILSRAGDLTANVAGNLGNAYFKKDNLTEAESLYTQAIQANRNYAAAWLGRANVRLKTGSLQAAITDYEQYLMLDPRSSQRPTIERLISFIRAEFAEAERRRLIAEEEARLEAERRQRLLNEVSASLQSAADASQGLSSGAENVEGYAGEFELE